jgi:membrane associated rhomboid family serine protease
VFDRWSKSLMAGLFAFFAVACLSAAATTLLGDVPTNPSFAPAAIATAVIFAAFAIWSFRDQAS